MTTHFSTQIEGNRLTLPEVRAAIKGARMPGRERDEREVRDHYLALGAMEELSERLGSLSEEDIRRLHGLDDRAQQTVPLSRHPKRHSRFLDPQHRLSAAGSP
jgi:Fic family protein